jgi:ABC-2 type transport system ATP-binding protein
MDNILVLQNLNKTYANFSALKDINLTLEPGRILGVLGPNGSGKTTLMKIVAGVLQPTRGNVQVQGHSPGPQTKSVVSYLPDIHHLPNWMSIHGMISYFDNFFKDFDPAQATALLDRLGIDPNQKVTALSKGMREKLRLSLALARQAKLYLMDELLEGIDPVARLRTIDTILDNFRPECSLIISTHLISEVEKLLDEVLFLKEGEIALYGNSETLRRERNKSIDGLYKEIFS